MRFNELSTPIETLAGALREARTLTAREFVSMAHLSRLSHAEELLFIHGKLSRAMADLMIEESVVRRSTTQNKHDNNFAIEYVAKVAVIPMAAFRTLQEVAAHLARRETLSAPMLVAT